MHRSNKELFYRTFELDRKVVDRENRSAELSFSSEEPVPRWYGNEILLHGRKNVDLSRLRDMGAVLLNHNPDNIVGPIRKAKVENRRGVAVIGFDDDEDGERAMRKVLAKSLRGVSVGYMINKAREVQEDEEYEGIRGPALVALRWTPYEISLTPIPADASVGIGRDLTRSLDGIDIERSQTTNKEDDTMNEEEIRQMIQEAISGLKIPSAKEAADEVRALIAEDAKPRMRIDTETYQDLLGRAGAVSLEVKAAVADMAVEGKTETEILRYITEQKAADPDAGDHGTGAVDDGTGRGTNIQPGNGKAQVTSFKQIENDDDFFRGLANPSFFSMQ